MKSLCVFCGSNAGVDPVYVEAAQRLGELLARRGITLIYGGGQVGLMGRLADAVLKARGRVIGVIPEPLQRREVAHLSLSELHVVDTMHQRKQMMMDLADGFIALPGGFGTFEEFCEILTWAQLGLHNKPCGLLNVKGYYAGLLALFDHAVAEQLLRPLHRSLVLTADEPELLLDAMASHQPPAVEQWLTRATT